MNFLAHAYLARSSPDLLVGGLLGDFVKGALGDRYDPAVNRGIQLHRAIDRYTDAHPLVRASCALVSPARRRFAAILVDVFYDHFLARHWQRYSDVPLARFTQQVYATLQTRYDSYPERLQRILPFMQADDWLASYAKPEAVDAALHGIARRFRRYPRAAVLNTGIEELLGNYAPLEDRFLEFFPQLCDFVETQLVVLTSPGPTNHD